MITTRRAGCERRIARFAAWRVDTAYLAAQAIAEVAAPAHKKAIALVLEGEHHIMLPVRAGLWAILLRNLLDNAVRYSGENTTVTVRIAETETAVELQVEDEGPGIAPESIAKAFARFDRLGRGGNEAGSGLGLSIVARIVELHRAHIELTSASGGRGLLVCVRIPKAAQ